MDEGGDTSSHLSEEGRLLLPRLRLNDEPDWLHPLAVAVSDKLKYYDRLLPLLREYSSSTATHIDFLVLTSLMKVICFQVARTHGIPNPSGFRASLGYSLELVGESLDNIADKVAQSSIKSRIDIETVDESSSFYDACCSFNAPIASKVSKQLADIPLGLLCLLQSMEFLGSSSWLKVHYNKCLVNDWLIELQSYFSAHGPIPRELISLSTEPINHDRVVLNPTDLVPYPTVSKDLLMSANALLLELEQQNYIDPVVAENMAGPTSLVRPIVPVDMSKGYETKNVTSEANLVPTATVVSEVTAFQYAVLHEAAHGFDEASKIGVGGFGAVYRAKLDDREGRPREVAIKKLFYRELNEQFRKEIWRISTVRHKNIVALLGYSVPEEGSHLLMVTPLHSSLYNSLYESAQPWLNWQARYKIALGVAEGLAYLHHGAPQRLVHGDVKAGNVLFDAETFEAYLADFGTSKIMSISMEETAHLAGTRGYMDPHFQKHLQRSAKIDVYSFGVLLFVLVSGEAHVPKLVEKSKRKDVVDDDFEDRQDKTYKSTQVRRVLWVARQCTKYEPGDRPSMSQVVGMLKGEMPCYPYVRALAALVDETLHEFISGDTVTMWYWRIRCAPFNDIIYFVIVLSAHTLLKLFFPEWL